MGPSRRQIALAGIVVMTAVVVGMAGVTLGVLPQGAEQASGGRGEGRGAAGSSPLPEVLREEGFEGTVDEWVNSLSDEDQATIDIAYESSVTSGYRGGRSDWLAGEVVARHGNDGSIIVTLPDGGELSVAAGGAPGSGDDASAGVPSRSTGGADPGISDADHDTGVPETTADHDEGAQAGRPPEGDNHISAAGTLLAVDTVRAHPGETRVAVGVSVVNNPGILGMTLAVSYDEASLTLVDSENGVALGNVLTLTHARSYQSGCRFTWDGVEVSPDEVRDGCVLTLYFDVAADAAAGMHSVAVRSVGSAYDNDLVEVGLSVQDGSVIVG